MASESDKRGGVLLLLGFGLALAAFPTEADWLLVPGATLIVFGYLHETVETDADAEPGPGDAVDDGPFPSVPESGTVVCSDCGQPVDRQNDCEACSSVGSWRK